MKCLKFLMKLHASIVAFLCCAASMAGAAEPVPVAKIARESARLRALVEFVGKKGANPTALAREFKKLSANGVTPGIRRGASFRLAGLYREHKNPDGAEKLYAELARSVADTWGVRAAVALGDMRRDADDPDAAVEAYERILRRNMQEPAAVRAALGVGLILEKRGDKANARKALEYGKAVAKQLYEADRKGLAGVLREIDAALRRLRPKPKPKPADAARLLREGNAALINAKNYAAALGKYGKLLKEFPESAEVDEAGHRRGLALYLMSKPEEARAAWEAFAKDKPEGPWCGHALVGLVDIYLEHELNAVKAAATLDRFFEGLAKKLDDWFDAEGDAWLRRAVVEYINNRQDECLAALDRAQVFRPAPEEIAKHGIPWGPGRLAAKLRKGEGITPVVVRRGGGARARTAIVLGDFYFEMREYEKAGRLLGMVNPPLAPITGDELTEENWREKTRAGSRREFDCVSWLKTLSKKTADKADLDGVTAAQRAYARLKEGRTFQHRLLFEAALPCYGEFLTAYAATPWVPEGVLRAAIVTNQMRPGGPRLSEALDRRVSHAIIWFYGRLGMCHLKRGSSFTDLMDPQARACLLRLPGLPDDKLVESLGDGSQMLALLAHSSRLGPTLLRRLVHRLSRRNDEAKTVVFGLLNDFMFGQELVAMLDVESLRELRLAANRFADGQQGSFCKIVSAACHGREKDVLELGTLSVVDAAAGALSGGSSNEQTLVEALGWDREEFALAQLTVAAASSDSAFRILLAELGNEKRSLGWRAAIARRLLTVVAYRRPNDAPVRNRVLPMLNNILAGIGYDKAHDEAFAWIPIVGARFAWLPPEQRVDAFQSVRSRLARHPLEFASFLYPYIAYTNTGMDPAFSLRTAEAVVETYEKAFAAESPSKAQTLNLLCMCRNHLTPERLPMEIPIDFDDDLALPGYLAHRPPEEWREWLSRFRELPVFRKARRPAGD